MAILSKQDPDARFRVRRGRGFGGSFGVLCMFSGESVSPDALNISQSCQSGLQRCMSFFENADKYGMNGASTPVHDALQDILLRTYKYSLGAVIGPVHIETIFNHTPPHSPLRPLIAKAALSTAGITGNTIRKQERGCERFAL
jgi:hypothetical protein